ncbi:MAG: NERD domain-containing protein [Coriobacteriia bacterium]|nr:NERD domain-containing protein [Coriobacteriia bacterium]
MGRCRQAKRSPLKHKALHNPGESLQYEMQELLEDQVLLPFVVAVMSLTFAVYEWWRFLVSAPPRPFGLTALAIGVCAWAARRFFMQRQRYRNLAQGLEGEKAVGQFLEDLRAEGCRVFHDVVGEGFNVDHVVISPHGIFAIETKTFSKPKRGEVKATVNGDTVLFNGQAPCRDPIVQARAARDWVRDLLHETTGRRFPVRAVVAVPGWFVERSNGPKSDVWVLNPKALPAFVQHEPVVLKDEDVALVSSRLVNHIVQ